MNWTSAFSQIFFGVILTSCTGSCMFLIWFLCRSLFQKRNPKFVYYMLRWVVIMYLLPIRIRNADAEFTIFNNSSSL